MRFSPPEQYWALQPLLDAGLDAEQISDLLVRLCFDAMVCADSGAPPDAMTPVEDLPPEVRAAWAETIDRMVRLDLGEGPLIGPASPPFRGTTRPR